MKIEEIKGIIKRDFEAKNSNEEVVDAPINIKDLDYQEKLEIMKYLLTEDNILNSSIILNILLLIKTGNSFDDSFFNSDAVWFKNLEEFLDFKMDLKAELISVGSNLVKTYLGVLKSVNLTENNYPDEVKSIPYTYQRLLLSMDFISLAPLLTQFNVDVKQDVPIIADAFNILIPMCNKFSMTGQFMTLFTNSIKGAVENGRS